MDYMEYAGVQHFFIYDNCLIEDECMESKLGSRSDIVTYLRWQEANYTSAQTPAYNHHFETHFPQFQYEVLLDIDEFPFSAVNTEPGFLRDYAIRREQDQIILRTIFYGGQSTQPSSEDVLPTWRIQRYTQRRAQPEKEGRTKPLYQPHRVNFKSKTNLHELVLFPDTHQRRHEGEEEYKYSWYDRFMGLDMIEEDTEEMRLNHYWCERLVADDQAFVKDATMLSLVEKVKAWKLSQKTPTAD